MEAIYLAWLAEPYRTATLRAVTAHYSAELPPGTRLGKPCKAHGHTWQGTPWCLRFGNHCRVCHPPAERLSPAERRRRNIERKRQARYRAGALPYDIRKVLWPAIKKAGRCPSVATLVMLEQRRYWREHPEARRAHNTKWTRERWRWRYMTSPDLRRYNHEKARRRKAKERGNHVVRVSTIQIRQRFQQFDSCCAYCGLETIELQAEHFLPISKGGTHVLSNILPACKACNYSKSDHDPELWYRQQPCFTEQRWRRILRVLGKQRAPVGQLSLV